MTIAAGALAAGAVSAQQPTRHLNPLIDLLREGKPVFGLYAPSATPRRAPRGATAPGADEHPKMPIQLATETLQNGHSDFVFNGSMEEGVDQGLPAFTEYVKAMAEAGGGISDRPYLHFPHPLIVKTPKIAPDSAKAIDNIGRELNTGVSGIMFVETESAEEVHAGLAAMRFKANGGTRPDNVGMAPAYWGMSQAEYKKKADLWPLNPDGELINWTIVESKEGLAHVREIAAVKGIGVLWPGAGTLRGVFTSTNAAGERVFDHAGWEAAIQQVLAACKEFHVPCGYPANATDIETRMDQGFSVFVMPWNDSGFKAVEIGRAAAHR